MTDIVFDNIIFSLQKTGGISSVWKELIDQTLQCQSFHCQFLEYANGRENLSRKELHINEDEILNLQDKKNRFERYRNPSVAKNTDFIFHSSYYRTCKNKHATNVTTVHDFVYEYYRTGLPKMIHHQQKKRAVLNSEAIICISNNTKTDLLHFFPQVDDKKVHVIYNGVSEVFTPVENRIIPDFIKVFGDYVLYIGIRKDPHKNFMNLVKALQLQSTFKLVLIGGGPLVEAETNHYDKYIKGRYTHLSNVSNEQLNLLYNFAFALVYPSVYEGFGIPILESQRAGCPVIATNRSSISEVAGEAAILTESGSTEDIVIGLEKLKESLYRKQLIENGLNNAGRFSWNRMVSEVLQLYNILLSK